MAQQGINPSGAVLAIVVLVLGLSFGIAAGWYLHQPPTPQAAPPNPDLRIVGVDSQLLEFEYGKLAEVAKEKNGSTGLKAFDTLRDAFTAMEANSNLTSFGYQDFELCHNLTVNNSFLQTMNASIQDNHNTTCRGYDLLARQAQGYLAGSSDTDTFQAQLYPIIMDLTELDNSIVQDP